jgi:hypothetical protein
MQDFPLDFGKKQEKSSEKNSDSLDMQVSSICEKDGKKLAYVIFADKSRKAEGQIPDCIITSNNGFSAEEIAGLEMYMKQNLNMLKSMAKSINPIKAMMK